MDSGERLLSENKPGEALQQVKKALAQNGTDLAALDLQRRAIEAEKIDQDFRSAQAALSEAKYDAAIQLGATYRARNASIILRDSLRKRRARSNKRAPGYPSATMHSS